MYMKMFILGLLIIVLVLGLVSTNTKAEFVFGTWSCSDPDSGNTPNTQSTVSITGPNSYSSPHLDSCSGSTLTEYYCIDASGNTAASSSKATEYDTTNTNAGLSQIYSSSSVSCANGCSNGACLAAPTDPCASVICNSPPGNFCTGNTLTTYSSSGTCSAGTCSYTTTTSTCSNGCSNGACTGQTNPCAAVTCSPTSKTCPDGQQVSCGNTCSNGICSQCAPSCTGHEKVETKIVESCKKEGQTTTYTIADQNLVLGNGCKLNELSKDAFASLPEINTYTCKDQTTLKITSEYCTEDRPYCDPNTNTCAKASDLSNYKAQDGTLFYPRAAKTDTVFYTPFLASLSSSKETNLLNLPCDQNGKDVDLKIDGKNIKAPPGIKCTDGRPEIEENCRNVEKDGKIVGASVPVVGSEKYEEKLDYVEDDLQFTFRCIGDKLDVSHFKLEDLGGESPTTKTEESNLFSFLAKLFGGFLSIFKIG